MGYLTRAIKIMELMGKGTIRIASLLGDLMSTLTILHFIKKLQGWVFQVEKIIS